MIGPILTVVVIVAICMWALSREPVAPGPPDDVRQQARARHDELRGQREYDDGWDGD